ncbi:MAG: Hsp20/alpha crystallin family protein [Spirochaetales bacterium]|nr:Hsp20/alpha crystallin family protein [Spirochaetales bacterium]
MAIVKWKKANYDPWDDMRSLQRSINDLFNLDHYSPTAGLFDRNMSPAVDVVEGESNFTVTVELPGIDKEDIDISFAADVLTIKGHKKEENEEKKGKFYKKEIVSGSFQRTLSFPNSVDGEKISAELKDGLLRLTLPKKEEAKTKTITVNVK